MGVEPNAALRLARERVPSRLAPGEPLSRAELADLVNAWLWRETGRRYALDDHAVGRWERGRVRWPIAPYRVGLRAVLGVDTDAALGFHGPRRVPVGPLSDADPAGTRDRALGAHDGADVHTGTGVGDHEEMEVNRRTLLRLFSLTGAALTLPPLALDAERMEAITSGAAAPDSTGVDDFARLNTNLWQVYALTQQKKSILPLLREQLAVLCNSLGRAHPQHRPHLCQLVSELYQLTGEVLFDADHYTDAAQCYQLAATAAQETKSHDLWAAALTRHAFVDIYGQQFTDAMPILNMASELARRGDATLGVGHWVAAVRAQVAAGIGDAQQCERDLDTASEIATAGLPPSPGGWLRFDGSRLSEQRGTCMIALGRLDAAEKALTDALPHLSTPRRRAGVTTDLALLGARRGDHPSVVMWLDDTLSAARTTESAFIARKLHAARPALTRLLRDPRVQRVDTEITELGRTRRTATEP